MGIDVSTTEEPQQYEVRLRSLGIPCIAMRINPMLVRVHRQDVAVLMQVVPSINQPGSVSDVEIIANNDLGDLCKVDKDSEVLMQIGSQCVHVEESKLEAILIALVKCCGQITKRNVPCRIWKMPLSSLSLIESID